MSKNRIRKVLIIGGVPPPVVGTTARIKSLITHPLFKEDLTYHLLDIVDRRSSDNMGRLELRNLLLGLKHTSALLFKLLKNRYSAAFLSIAQNKWGFIRDSFFVWICWFFRIRIVAHLDGGYFGRFYSEQKTLFRAYIRLTCGRISTGIVLGESLRDNFEGLVKNVRVVHAGIPLIGPGSRNRSVKRVLFLSSLFRSKGYLDVLRSVKLVVDEYPNVEFVFIGREGIGMDDPDGYDVSMERKKIVNADKIGSHVSFPGPIYGADRDEQFRSADVFVFPTYYIYEGKPAVVLQAMSAELPVVTTRYPGSEDLIQDGVNGFFVEPENPRQISSRLLILLKDQELRMKMGVANREKIQREYSVASHVRNTIDVLINNSFH